MRSAPAVRSITLAESIVLRPYDASDAGELLVAVDGTRDRLARWMPWVPFATTVQDFEDFIRVAIRHDRDGSGLHRGLFDSERLIGTVGASIGSLNFDEADVGYWLAESHEGLGLASLATGHLIEWLFSERDMHRITIRAAVANRRSRVLAERLGFTFEGTLRGSLLLEGHHEDAALYSLLQHEWSQPDGPGGSGSESEGPPTNRPLAD